MGGWIFGWAEVWSTTMLIIWMMMMMRRRRRPFDESNFLEGLTLCTKSVFAQTRLNLVTVVSSNSKLG